MSNQGKENLQTKFSKLSHTFFNSILKIGIVIGEVSRNIEINQDFIDNNQLTCINNGVFDFNLIEKDIERIHKQIELDEDKLLGSYLIIKAQNSEFLVEIEIYLQRQESTFRRLINVEVTDIENLPSDVADELNTSQEVKLHLEN